ncbi:MAG: glucose-6-phosphate isomerase [Roseiflexaceae bacterium]
MTNDRPYTYGIDLAEARLDHYDTLITRRLSALRGQFADQVAYQRLLDSGDPEIYQVYELRRPEVPGELLHGLSVLHPGMVGAEYYMTKGHFHRVLETGEVYHCLKGQGVLVMETPEGQWAVEPLHPGRVLYVPPRWAHRSVNTSHDTDLVTLFIYPGHAGHDYGTIEQFGFRKRIIEQDGQMAIIDNPAWRTREERV